MLAAYTVTMFVSAGLLFLVQPMFARFVLPLLGGSPAVWNTAVVFYQAALLAGYAYAHATTRWLAPRRQVALHALVLLLPLAVLPVGVPAGWQPPGDANPIPWLLGLLAVTVGPPFFVVSATSPLLQAWFARTDHAAAGDPYFLYAASNVGSLLALVSYPLVVEPSMRLGAQSRLWAAGYGILAALVLVCGALVRRAPASRAEAAVPAPAPAPLGAGRRTRWVLLAFVPSSLMLSVTTYLTTIIAPIPLLWVVPLAMYLFTFVLVFARRQLVPAWLVLRALPYALLPLAMVVVMEPTQPMLLLMGLHLAAFFLVTMACHGALARDRPAPAHLTEYYLWLSAGGVLGGMFTALVAPLVFTTLAEYPLVLTLGCLLLPAGTAAGAPAPRAEPVGVRDLNGALGVAALVAVLALVVRAPAADGAGRGLMLMFVAPGLLCFSFSRRPVRFGLGLGALLLAGTVVMGAREGLVHAERSFFGVHRVRRQAEAGRTFHMLLHGTTLHGTQDLDPARRREPLTYYARSGPIGQVFGTLRRTARPLRVALIGLGTGSVACYRRPGERWTYYEIDPVVEHIARDPRYFTFLADCAPDVPVVLGDARISLADAPPAAYDVIVLDAYSSDAIPIHLITREALALYLEKLAPGGLLAFHISNRYLDLRPVVGALARDAGLAGLAQDDWDVDPAEQALGKRSSDWAVMARTREDLGALAADPRWKPLAVGTRVPVWTDDYSSLVRVVRWW